MAEDETDLQQIEEDEEDVVGRRIQKEHRDSQRRRKCNSRIEQLATPNKRFILALWQEHAYHFEKERAENIKARLQELYAMSPEETEKYFEKLRKEARRLAWRKHMREKLRCLVAKRRRLHNIRKAYRLFRKLLIRAMKYAHKHEPPILVSARLRMLSDIILEHLCDLRGVDFPDRGRTDKFGRLLIAVADWFAIGVEHIYFVVQIKKNEELEEIEKTYLNETSGEVSKFEPPASSTQRESEKEVSQFEPAGSSTPRLSADLEAA